jgi:hypothetical protein
MAKTNALAGVRSAIARRAANRHPLAAFNRLRGISLKSNGAAIARLAGPFRDLPRVLCDLVECLVVILHDCVLAMMTDLATGSLSRRFQ